MSLPPGSNSKDRKQWEKDNAKPKTDVIFRRYRSGTKDIIAIFPAIYSGEYGCVQSYLHVGQHGACNYWALLPNTRIVKDPANDPDCKKLITELESEPYLYNLKIVRKMTGEHRDALEKQRREISTTLYKDSKYE